MADPYQGTHYEVVPMSDDPVVRHRGPWVIKGPSGEEEPLYFRLEVANRHAKRLENRESQTTLDLDE